MDKTYIKVPKDPKRAAAARKGRGKYMRRKVFLIIQKKVGEILLMQAMKLTALPTLPPPQDQMILMSMALAYLLPLPSVFVYFLQITVFSLVNEKQDQPPKRRLML